MNKFLQEEFGDWYKPLEHVLESEYFQNIPKQLSSQNYTPSKENLFKAFKLCQLNNTKVLILGQNPYPTKGHATGLAFGVPDSTLTLPPTLNNVRQEVENSTGLLKIDFDVTLESWAKQGVLLLNTALTTNVGVIENVHGKIWENFIIEVFKVLNMTSVIYVLWGNHAKSYKKYISPFCDILEAAHPSPMSAHKGFFGCNHFQEINKLLKDMHNEQIKW